MKFIFTTIAAFVLFFGCSSSSISGGSTTVENPFVICVVTDSNNRPLTSMPVSLYPETYNPLLGDTFKVHTAFTDSSGIAIFTTVSNESYSIVAGDSTIAAFHSYLDWQMNTSDTILLTATPVSSIRVHADSGTQAVYFKGSPFRASLDSATHVYTFVSLPAGNYPLLSIISDSDTTEMADIIVESDREVELFTSGEKFEYYPVISALNEQSGMNVISTSTMNDMVWFGTADSGVWSVSGDSLGLQYFGGSTSFFNNRITSIEAHPEWKTSEQPINLLLSSPQGTMHFQDSSGRFLEKNEYPGVGNSFAQAMHIDRSGRAWTAYDTVICYTDDKNEWSGRLALSQVVAFAGDYDDTLFLGHQNGTITGVTPSDTFELDILSKTIPDVTLTDVALDNKGTIICGTSRGIYGIERDNSLLTTFESSVHIKTLEIDAAGTIFGLFDENSIVTAGSNGVHYYSDLFGDTVVIYDISLRGKNSLYVAAGVKGALRCDF